MLVVLGACGDDPAEDASVDMSTKEDAHLLDTDEADAETQPDMASDGSPDDASSQDAADDVTVTPDQDIPDADLPDRMVDGPGIPGAHPDIVRVIDVRGRNPGRNWHDSYSVGSQCYCASTFDHNIGGIRVATPVGMRTVRQVCDAIGPGPGIDGRPRYNDIQCGNGPANDAGDEDDCPGRVDIGREGCGHIGPTWDLSVVR